MKKLLLFPLFALLFTLPAMSYGQKLRKAQKKFFPKELRKQKVYFGMAENDLLRAFPDAKKSEATFDFRNVYQLGALSKRIQDSHCYIDNEDDLPVYEFILIMADAYNNEDLGRELFGPPNFNNEEWRLKPGDTGLDFEVAAWTFQNKLIIAAAWPGSEWEEGFDD